jgi:hypothetical protein
MNSLTMSGRPPVQLRRGKLHVICKESWCTASSMLNDRQAQLRQCPQALLDVDVLDGSPAQSPGAFYILGLQGVQA